MLLLAAGVSLMRGERYVHNDAAPAGEQHHDTPLESLAREGDAVAVPAVPDEQVAYDDALTAERR